MPRGLDARLWKHGCVRVAVVAMDDPDAVQTWSGIPAHMCEGLRSLGVEVLPIGPLHDAATLAYSYVVAARNRLLPGHHAAERDKWVLERIGRRATRALEAVGQVDLVLAPGTLPVTHLQSNAPVVVWADATVYTMVGYYDEFTRWTSRSIRAAKAAERQALSKLHLFVGCSDWVTASAIDDYGLDGDRVAVVPFGANVASVPLDLNCSRPEGIVRLLSVGAYWERKGFDLAIAAVEDIRSRGVDARLDLVGASPPAGVRVPPFVEVHGFLDKSRIDERSKLDLLYREAHVFVLPTRAECYGIVFCEAAAYGLPVIAPRTGGIPSIVDQGRTGLLVPAGSGHETYGDAVLQVIGDEYETLSQNSHQKYLDELNWSTACSTLLTLVAERSGP
jgi:glycosyltransferase involved in cell wall biosynthesis